MTTLDGIAGLNRALRALPKEASAELRDASQEIAGEVADKARAKASGMGGAAAKVAPTIKARRDRVPVVAMGSKKRIERGRSGDRQTVGDLIWGAEFGGRGRNTTQQFLPHRGQDGYFLWPAVREADIGERYSEALLDALNKIG